MSAKRARVVFRMALAAWLPDLPVVLAVLFAGALGGVIADFCKIPLEGWPPRGLIASHETVARLALGMIGAGASVFLLAKTDTTKVWHCFFFALICGVAGPAFVVRGLEAVTGISQQAKQTQEAKVAVQTSIDDVRQASKDAAGTEDPRKIDRALDTISDKSSEGLKAANELPESLKQQKISEIGKITLQSLQSVSSQAPDKAFAAAKDIAVEAQKAGNESVGAQAIALLSNVANNEASSASAKTAARKYEEELKKQLLVEPRVYVITPDTLTESALAPVKAAIKKAGYQDIQPPVHPKRPMDSGFEVVFYLPEDQKEAEALVRAISGDLHWLQKPPVKAPLEKSARPRQFDIHVGPDLAEQLMHVPPNEKTRQ